MSENPRKSVLGTGIIVWKKFYTMDWLGIKQKELEEWMEMKEEEQLMTLEEWKERKKKKSAGRLRWEKAMEGIVEKLWEDENLENWN